MQLWQSVSVRRGVTLRVVAGLIVLTLTCFVAPAATLAQNAYITNSSDNTVSVISTATNTVIGSPIPVGTEPFGVAVTPDGSKVYVTNVRDNTVSVIDTTTNTVIGFPIPVGNGPFGVAVTPDGSKVYITNESDNTVSVISTVTNTVVGLPIPVGVNPVGVAVTPDGSKVYVANARDNTVSVISTATNTVIGLPIPVGVNPVAFGLFIQPAKKFAGRPGQANCRAQSVRALGQKFDGLNDAATALGYGSVSELQRAITTFCEG